MEEQPGMSGIDAYKLELRKNTEALEKNESDIVRAEKEVQKHLDDEHCRMWLVGPSHRKGRETSI